MLADRTWPPPGRLEPITTHPEGGWIATGQCGRPHLIGGEWAWWWACPHCRQLDAIAARQAQIVADAMHVR